MKKNTLPLGIKPGNSEKYSMIIVDHSFLDRMLLRKFFIYEHFEIISELEKTDAILSTLKALEKQPDLICVYYDSSIDPATMSVIKEVREKYPKIKFIITAPFAEKTLIQELSELQIVTLVIKPYVKQQINEKLARLLNRMDTLDDTVIEYEKNGINLNEIKLPPLSSVIYKVLTFDSNNPSGGSQELEQIISPDKSLAASIIRMSNSAFYGRSGSIKTLKDAITLLGMKTVKNLVIVNFKRNFTKAFTNDFFKRHLQTLPILSSLIAFDLTSPLKLDKLREEIFVLTLLKKIGMTVLATNFNKPYLEILKLSEVGVKDLWILEKENLNITSAELGEKVFNFWKMPDLFKQTMRNQYFSIEDIDKVSNYDRLSRLSDLIAYRLIGIYQNDKNKEIEIKLLEFFKAPEEMRELFNEDYYETIQDHPFFNIY
jgi:HD-like signal output (HDOD) protein